MVDEEREEGAKQEEVNPQGPSKTKKMALIAGGVVLVLIILIGTPILIFSLAGGDDVNPDMAKSYEEFFPDGFYEDELDETEEALGAFYPMESFVVNLSGGNYLRVQLQLEFMERDIPPRFYTRIVPVRDAIISLLTAQSKEDIIGPRGQDNLKIDIRERINAELRREDIKRVYFTQFIIQ